MSNMYASSDFFGAYGLNLKSLCPLNFNLRPKEGIETHKSNLTFQSIGSKISLHLMKIFL